MGVVLFGGATGVAAATAVLVGRGVVEANVDIALHTADCVGIGLVSAVGVDASLDITWSGCVVPPATVWTEIGVP